MHWVTHTHPTLCAVRDLCRQMHQSDPHQACMRAHMQGSAYILCVCMREIASANASICRDYAYNYRTRMPIERIPVVCSCMHQK